MALKITGTMIIRSIAGITTLVAAIFMVTNDEKTTKSATYFYEAKYIYWGAFMFFVIAYFVASIWNFIISLLPPGSPFWRLVVLVDWIVTTLMIASFGMTANSYKEMNIGVVEAGWSPQCYIVPAFCSRVVTSLAFGSIGLLICVPVFIYSIIVLANPFLVQTD